MNINVQKKLDDLFRDLTSFGSAGFFALVLLLTLFLNGSLFIDLLMGFIITLAVVVIIRSIYFKDRPHKQDFHNFIEKIEASSFPSLHSARITFLALTFSYYFSNRFVSVFCILITTLVIYSRIHIKKHDWVDVIAGMILGGLVFWLVSLI